MARPREFDIDDALDDAMHAFWQRGYEATSLADLMAVTGLQKGSLYKAFGDKHNLFMQALSRYLEQRAREQREVLAQAPTVKEGLLALLTQAIDVATDPKQSCRGCLAVNSVVELSAHDTKAAERLNDHMQRTVQRIAGAIAQGQACGELRQDIQADTLAQWLLVFLTGLLASLRGPLDKASARELAQLTLKLVE